MKSIKQILEADLKDNEAAYAEYLTLVEFAKPYEGKKITRAIANKLPVGYKLTDGYSGLEIIAPSGRKHAFIRKEDMNEFTLKKFEDFNPPYSRGASERIEKLKGILENPKKLKKCEEYFNDMKKAYDELKKLAKESEDEFGSYENPAFYDILKEYKISSDIISDLRFDKDEDKFEKGGTALDKEMLDDIAYDIAVEHQFIENGKWKNDDMKAKAYKLAELELMKYGKGGKAGAAQNGRSGIDWLITGQA